MPNPEYGLTLPRFGNPGALRVDETIIPSSTLPNCSWNGLSVTTWTNRTGLRAHSLDRSTAGRAEIHYHHGRLPASLRRFATHSFLEPSRFSLIAA